MTRRIELSPRHGRLVNVNNTPDTYYDDDPRTIRCRTVAVIGHGSQGHAHALFTRRPTAHHDAGRPLLTGFGKRAAEHPIEITGGTLRAMTSWVHRPAETA